MKKIDNQVARERYILCKQFYTYLKNKEFIIWSSWDLDLSKMLTRFLSKYKNNLQLTVHERATVLGIITEWELEENGENRTCLDAMEWRR